MKSTACATGGWVLSKCIVHVFSRCLATICALVTLVWTTVQADQIEMQNGDRYAGTVLTLTTNHVVLQSDVLGIVNLPRGKVTTITLGVVAPANKIQTAAAISGKARTPQPLIITNSPQQ